MSNLFDYSQTAASNNSAAPDGAPEGMLPSAVNNTIRQVMANAAGAFTCYTAGGSANAQTVTMSPALAAYSNKVRIAFIPVASNTGACTLNVNGLGAVSIKMLDGTDPPAGALNSSGVAVVQHNGTNLVLLNPAVAVYEAGTFTGTLTGFTSNPSGTVNYVKIGRYVELWVSTPITGTSNAADMSMIGLPSGLNIGTGKFKLCGAVIDDNVRKLAECQCGSSTTLTFTLMAVSGSAIVNGGGSSFTSSGTKGLGNNWAISFVT